MIIAIAVLFVLYLSNAPKQNSPKRCLSKMPKAQFTEEKESETIKTGNKENSNCPHDFGYLRNRKGKGVPEECVGCFELVKCMLGADYCMSYTSKRANKEIQQ